MASTYAIRSVSSAETFNKLTVSCWFKGMADGTQRGIWGIYDNSDSNKFFGLYYSSNGSLYGYWKEQSSGYLFTLGTMQKFYDPNAWYNFVMTVDTTLATASDRVKYYLNGERITVFEDTLDTITQSKNIDILDDTNGRIQWGGNKISGTQYYWNGSMSHCHMCVGYAYDASSFGSTDATTGEWKINTSPSVSYGTNGGFWFKDGNQLTDSSTNSNTLTVGGGTLTKTEDSPSNVFATLNPLVPDAGSVGYYHGNTQQNVDTSAWRSSWSTIGASSGKYYFESYIEGGSYIRIGARNVEEAQGYSSADYVDRTTNGYSYDKSGEVRKNDTVMTGGTTGVTFTTGDIIGCLLDLDNWTINWTKNGTLVNSTAYNITQNLTYVFGVAGYSTARIRTNFGNGYFQTTQVSSAGTNASGNGIFEYDVPTGYTALSTKGLNL